MSSSVGQNCERLSSQRQIPEKAANQLISDGLLESASIPAQLVPHHADYTENVRILKALYQDWDMISNIAKEVGFSEAGMKFNKTILEIISTLPNSLEEFLLNPLPNPVTQKMITEHDGQHYFRGDIVLTKPLTPQNLEKLSALNTDGVIMTGWSTLSATLQPMVKSDFKTLFLPAACVILLALGIVFRNLAETLLVVIILIVSLATVNAIMVLVGLQWNFLNGVAFPLIIGVGIDYGIHLIFSLRRHNGKESTKHGVGLAITFCGLSSIIGFGSLAFADNALLQSLGLISALGVAITMTLTLYVIPPVWRWLRLKR